MAGRHAAYGRCRFTRRKGDRMRRSAVVFALLVLALLVPSRAADAQPPTKIPQIGYVSNGVPRAASEGFRQGLRDLGFVEGQNIIIEWRFAQRQADRLPGPIAGLIGLPVDIIVTTSTQVTTLARNATKTIPIARRVSSSTSCAGSRIAPMLTCWCSTPTHPCSRARRASACSRTSAARSCWYADDLQPHSRDL